MQRFGGVVQDTAGNALASVTVTVFNAGSTGLATIYSDNSRTALVNPFTANVNGTYEFYAQDGRYDVQPTKAAYSISTVPVFDAVLYDGPSLVVFNVKDYGAKGDGATNDAGAIQAAAAAAVTAGGRIVYFPAGTYVIAVPITVTPTVGQLDASVHFVGVGRSLGSRIRPSTGFVGAALIDIGDGTNLTQHWSVRGLDLSGKALDNTLKVVSGIRARRTAQWEVLDSQFESLQTGIEVTGISSVGLIAHNVVGSNNVVGLKLDQVSDVRVVANELLEGRVGSGASSHAINGARIGPRMVIVGNKINNWEGDGINVGAFSGVNTPGTIVGNNVSDCGGHGIYVQEEGVVVTGNHLGAMKAGATAGIRVTAGEFTVTGNFVDAGSLHTGIRIESLHGTITGNTVRRANPTGIDLPDATNVAIVGNRVYDDAGAPTMTNGILERLTANTNLVEGNHITNATGAKIVKVGAASAVRQNVGHVTEASGTGTINNGATSAVVTHGLSVTPTLKDITINFGENPTNDPGNWWVDTIGAANFTVHVRNDPGASNLDFSWMAQVL